MENKKISAEYETYPLKSHKVRGMGLEPTRRKTQEPKSCASTISPLARHLANSPTGQSVTSRLDNPQIYKPANQQISIHHIANPQLVNPHIANPLSKTYRTIQIKYLYTRTG